MVKISSYNTKLIKLLREKTTDSKMLDSPLKKNKHSYPLDFSSKKKELPKHTSPKYDILLSDQENPEYLPLNKKDSVELSASSISELFIDTNKKLQSQNHFQVLEANQALNQSQSQKQASLFYNSDFNLDQIQQPLKSIKKLNHRIVVDQEKLNNPRIQFNEDKTIATTDKTIETVSPQIPQKTSPKMQAGAIRHQNFKYFEQFENQKQPPLLPQKPFHLVHKRAKRSSLLQKLNLHKITQKSQASDYEAFVNSQITSGSKTFLPETYSYVNRMMSNQDLKHLSEQKARRVNSSFDTKKKQKIIYMNHENLGSLSFNLPNLSLNNSAIKFNKQPSEPEANLKNRFKQLSHSFLSNSKNNFLNNHNTRPGLQATQIQRLKAQINILARSRFKNKEEQQNPSNPTDRQFTFQDEQKNQSSIKKPHSKPLPKKPTKKFEITYHVPLANLKRLCKMYLASPNNYHIAFKVPKIFMEKDLFYRNQPKQELHENALFLFESLKINSKDMVIKRYSNCIMFICGHVVVMWHYNGKRYLGGWQYEYLDEGSKHGLGLEWQPDLYIYYGEFRNNKKHGLGALKQGPEKTTVGYWMNGKYSGTVFKEQNETFSESEQQNSPQNESDSLYEYKQQERDQHQR